jgi:hypothetical protein
MIAFGVNGRFDDHWSDYSRVAPGDSIIVLLNWGAGAGGPSAMSREQVRLAIEKLRFDASIGWFDLK